MDINTGKRYLKSQEHVLYNDSFYVIDSLVFRYVKDFVVCKAVLKDLNARESYVNVPIRFVRELSEVKSESY